MCERGLALVLVTGLIAGALSPVASQQPKSDNTAQSAQGKEQNTHATWRTLTDADNNHQVTINKGSVLAVRLAANPSTGYSWRVGGDPAPLVLQSTKYESTSADPTRVGSRQVQVLRFKASSAGTTSLFLEYRRPWEKNVGPARTFRVNVTIQ